MKTETLPSLKMEVEDVDALGFGQSQRFEIIGNPLAFMALRQFYVCINNMDTEELSSYEISFEEFALKHPDCDGKFVTCFQYDKDGDYDEKQLAVWDFIYNVFYTPDEPYFTESQKVEFKKSVEETLLNIIESKY